MSKYKTYRNQTQDTIFTGGRWFYPGEIGELPRNVNPAGLTEVVADPAPAPAPAPEVTPADPEPAIVPEAAAALESMTKAQLVELAEAMGIDVPATATKAQITQAIQGDDDAG